MTASINCYCSNVNNEISDCKQCTRSGLTRVYATGEPANTFPEGDDRLHREMIDCILHCWPPALCGPLSSTILPTDHSSQSPAANGAISICALSYHGGRCPAEHFFDASFACCRISCGYLQ